MPGRAAVVQAILLDERCARDDWRFRLAIPKRSRAAFAARRANMDQIGFCVHLARGPPVRFPFFVCVLRHAFHRTDVRHCFASRPRL